MREDQRRSYVQRVYKLAMSEMYAANPQQGVLVNHSDLQLPTLSTTPELSGLTSIIPLPVLKGIWRTMFHLPHQRTPVRRCSVYKVKQTRVPFPTLFNCIAAASAKPHAAMLKSHVPATCTAQTASALMHYLLLRNVETWTLS